MSSTRSQTIFGVLPVLARSASSFFCAACSCAGNESAGSMLSLTRTALLSVDACAKHASGRISASTASAVQANIWLRFIGLPPAPSVRLLQFQDLRLHPLDGLSDIGTHSELADREFLERCKML